jgi:hypothetical protein
VRSVVAIREREQHGLSRVINACASSAPLGWLVASKKSIKRFIDQVGLRSLQSSRGKAQPRLDVACDVEARPNRVHGNVLAKSRSLVEYTHRAMRRTISIRGESPFVQSSKTPGATCRTNML